MQVMLTNAFCPSWLKKLVLIHNFTFYYPRKAINNTKNYYYPAVFLLGAVIICIYGVEDSLVSKNFHKIIFKIILTIYSSRVKFA